MSRPTTVLVLTRNIGGFYQGGLLVGMIREIRAAGGRVIIAQTREPTDDGTQEPTSLSPYYQVAWDDVDGVIAESLAARQDYLEAARSEGKPVVLASHHLAGFEGPSAVPDNRGGIRIAVEHLIAHGHTRIGFVGPATQHDFRERHAGYLEAMAAQGLPAGDELYFAARSYSIASGAEAALAVLAADPRPTALVTATDDNAIGVMRTLAAAGVTVPDEIAVVGFDNVDECAFTVPSLSSVGQPYDELGSLAAKLLLRMIAGEDVPARPYIAQAAALAARGSCGCRVDLVDQRPHRRTQRVRKPIPMLRAELGAVLRTLLERGEGTAHDVDEVIAEVERLHAVPSGPDEDEGRTLIGMLEEVKPDPETLQQVAAEILEYVRALDAAEADGSAVNPAESSRLRAALWELQARGWVRRAQRLEAAMQELNNVSEKLLSSGPQQIQSLTWLAGTHVTAGVLALWDGPPSAGKLRVTGVFDAHGALKQEVGELVDVRHFPPAELVAAGGSEVCVVVPVRNSEHDWGLLCVLGVLDATSHRDTYQEWTRMLSSALLGEQLQHTIRTSEERYAHVSRAANDGLWELDTKSRTMYLSDRCREILDLAVDEFLDADGWEERQHPDDREAVTEAMSQALANPEEPVELEYRVRTRDGKYRWVMCRALGIRSGTDAAHRLVGSISDVGERRHLEEQLLQAALFDPVTGLPNRRLFLDRLAVAIRSSLRRPESHFAVLFLDLDGFKLVNDSLGHLAGDDLLRIVGERLLHDLRATDTAARFGGDEFAVLLTDPNPDELLSVTRRIQERIATPVQLGGQEVSVTASVGIALSDTGYTDAEDVLRDADIAMYQSKETERGTASVFDPEMHKTAVSRLRAKSDLNAALECNQFVVHYQPVVPLDGTALTQLEALVRWEHPERGLLLPAEFLPAMVDNSTIVRLGHWILDEVCRQIAEWRGTYDSEFAVSVNVSHREFWVGELLLTATQALERHGVPARFLILEITESVIMTDPEAARDIMAHLAAAGIRLQVDDFGTGHSSLNALRMLPVDALKIDGSFVAEMPTQARTTELVRAIVAMGAALGLDVIAECVETPEQADELRGMGCGSAQGWLFAKAVPASTAGALLGTVMMGAQAPA